MSLKRRDNSRFEHESDKRSFRAAWNPVKLRFENFGKLFQPYITDLMSYTDSFLEAKTFDQYHALVKERMQGEEDIKSIEYFQFVDALAKARTNQLVKSYLDRTPEVAESEEIPDYSRTLYRAIWILDNIYENR